MECLLSKFAGYVHHGKSILVNYFGCVDKNKMAAMGVSLTGHQAACQDFPVVPLQENVLFTQFSNYQEMFIPAKPCVGAFFPHIEEHGCHFGGHLEFLRKAQKCVYLINGERLSNFG